MVSCISEDLLRKFYNETSQDSSSETSQEIIDLLQRTFQVVSGSIEASQLEMCNNTCAVLIENEALIKAIGWDILHILIHFTTPDPDNMPMAVLRYYGQHPLARVKGGSQIEFTGKQLLFAIQEKYFLSSWKGFRFTR